jgi:hypothetical protein
MEHSLVWVDEKASDFSHDAVKCPQQQTTVIFRFAASLSSASNWNWGDRRWKILTTMVLSLRAISSWSTKKPWRLAISAAVFSGGYIRYHLTPTTKSDPTLTFPLGIGIEFKWDKRAPGIGIPNPKVPIETLGFILCPSTSRMGCCTYLV